MVISILHPEPKTNMSRPGIERGPPASQAITLAKNYLFEQLVNHYSEHLHMSARPVENARDKSLILNVSKA